MSIFSYINAAHLKRFLKVLRHEGLRPACQRAWYYLRLSARGNGRSALSQNLPKGRPTLTPRYLDRFWRDMAQAGAFTATHAPAVLMKRRKVVMIGDMNLPQCRKYRVEQLAEFWNSLGIDYDFAAQEDVAQATALMQDATHLMFYRTQSSTQMSMYLYEARRLRLPIAYDIDDPLFSVPAYETYSNMAVLPEKLKTHFLAQAPLYLDAMHLGDLISVATPGLQAHAQSLCARPVHLRRNFADQATIEVGKAARNARLSDDIFRVAFASGSQGHEADFARIADQIEAFITGAPNRELMLLGPFDPAHLPNGLQNRVRQYEFSDYASYLANLAQADCAVMPLADDLFNRCKSGVRVIDAAAVAVPSFVSNVGDFAHIVDDGRSGRVFATDAQSWADALQDLAQNRETATAMGQAAYADLHAQWTCQPGLNDHIVDPQFIDWVRA